jgi:hypothetical protein
VEVINNHSQFSLDPIFSNKVDVIHNTVRPDWSTGHLSRDYNSAYLRRFRNLNTPDYDWVLTCQDDILWKPEWASVLKNMEDYGYNFITSGPGDSFVAATAEAIKTIGIWDERFCAIGYHEADMFLRALIWNRNRSSINDVEHVRVWNASDHAVVYPHTPLKEGGLRGESDLIQIPNWNSSRLIEADRSRPLGAPFYNYDIVDRLFSRKWPGVNNHTWQNVDSYPQSPAIETPWLYPYFERDIDNVGVKGYR